MSWLLMCQRGWNRSGRPVAGVTIFGGRDELLPFLSGTNILVSLLPHTGDTISILNRQIFSTLPRDAYVINAGRGEQMVEEDLLEFVRSGHLAGATLDVFRKEPLPLNHPFWDEEKMTVTPHIASWVDPAAGTGHVLRAIEAFERGEKPQGLVDRQLGYQMPKPPFSNTRPSSFGTCRLSGRREYSIRLLRDPSQRTSGSA